MLKLILIALLPVLGLFGNGTDNLFTAEMPNGQAGETGTLEKMVPSGGSVTIELDLKQLNGNRNAKTAKPGSLHFGVQTDSYFTVLVFNNELRGPVPSSLKIFPQGSVDLPAKLKAAYDQLVIENLPWGGQYEMAIRDEKSGFVFFNIEGQDYNYNADQASFSVQNGRLLISDEFAAALGRPADAGSAVGKISISTTMRAIEVTQFVNSEVVSEVMPAQPSSGTVPGPDVIVGDLNGLSQPETAAAGTQVGISVGTDSCNIGTVDLDWFQTPNNDHPVIPQNMYRMSGGATNDERFEQIGQSNVKHAFTALTENICSLGCNGVGGTHLGSGCSDPYVVSLNSGGSTHNLGSRAWINPFTGAFPRADSATPPNSHTGHTHNSVSHRMVVEIADLSTTQNPGATYYAEAQYITPHEYVWCQANPGQCNMYNNVSFRRYNVTGITSPFSFSAAASTVRTKPAIVTWSGATENTIEPAPGQDGIGIVAYKVTNPSPGVWHYEYAVYNQNLDRGIQSFSVPVGAGASVTNIGFHAPPQQPAWANDGTAGSTGFSSVPWAQTLVPGSMTWNSETFAQNQNANAIRWGTMYNFRFDSNIAPQLVNATVGFLKTGSPITVQVQAPGGTAATPTPTPTPTATPTPTPSPTPGVPVNLSGRVTDPSGRGLQNVIVKITDANGGFVTATTSSFGFYSFDNVMTNQTYTITVISRSYRYARQQVQVLGPMSNLDFVGLE